MDGRQGRVGAAPPDTGASSLRRRLSVWIALTILALTLVAGSLSFVLALDDAYDRQDDLLRQVENLVLFDQIKLPAQPGAGLSIDDDDHDDDDEQMRIFVEYLVPAGVQAPAPLLAVPDGLSDGLHNAIINGKSYRVLIRTRAPELRVAIAQETDLRAADARAGALRTVMPMLLLIPVLLLLIPLFIHRAVRPIAALAAAIDARGDDDLRSLEAGALPREIRSFVVAINRLLGRIGQSMAAQRRFVADAAHELRTPLTALSLQAERLAATPLPAPAQERLAALRQGLERSRNLLEQLLTLARLESAADAPRMPTDMIETCRRVIENLLPLAEAKHIDLGLELRAHGKTVPEPTAAAATSVAGAIGDDTGIRVYANPTHLYLLIRNLADNAIRYSPEGGRVDIVVETLNIPAPQVRLSVRDEGPGIPAAELSRVFDPFYRIPGTEQIGSGLGLSIVRTVAERLGGRIALGPADAVTQRGLEAQLTLPRCAD